MGELERYEDVLEEFGVLTDYERGFVDGLRGYAWWQNGRMHVGTSGKTLAAAVRDFLTEQRNKEA